VITCLYIHSFPTGDGQLYTFGEDETGKLGLASDLLNDTRSPQPVAKLNDGDRYMKVRCGARHTVAITEKGCCYSWGN